MLKIQVKGIEKVQAFLREIPLGVKTRATRAVAQYLIGIEELGDAMSSANLTGGTTHGLAHYVPYRHVSVAQAGGWKSDKQRRYVMAMIREGKIDPGVPHRTGEMQRGYRIEGEPPRYRIVNEVPYTDYVMSDTQQSRMHQLIGWRKVSVIVASNIRGAMRHAQAKVSEWLKEQKKK